MAAESDGWSEIWQIVRQIPPGRVMSYGQVAALLDRPLSARAVGWAMHGCPADVPWQRVVAVSGACSADRSAAAKPGRQRALLESEGVAFDSRGRVDMSRHRWQPQEPEEVDW